MPKIGVRAKPSDAVLFQVSSIAVAETARAETWLGVPGRSLQAAFAEAAPNIATLVATTVNRATRLRFVISVGFMVLPFTQRV
jgi:hypothetical protein